MASSASSNATPSGPSSFNARVQDVKFDKALINELIMDYFVREGFPEAATQFSREANIQPQIGTGTVQERVEIKNCIHAGQIQQAIEKIIALEPQLLDSDPALHFALVRLQLIEMIKPYMLNTQDEPQLLKLLEFSEKQLAPRASTNPQFLRELEETMALVIFEPAKVHTSLKYQLEPELKQLVAKRVNEAILRSMGEDRRGRLLELIRTRQWAENRARQAKKKEIPARIDVGLDPPRDGLDTQRADDGDSIMQMGGNGHSDASNLMVS